MRQVSTKLTALISETDQWKKQMLADTIKDMLEDSPEIWEKGQEAKPVVKVAIDTYARNPNLMNQLQLLNALGTIGL